MIRRSRLLIGFATFAVSGVMGVSGPFSHDDPAIAQVRRGNLGDAPFSRIQTGVATGLNVVWTSDIVRRIQSGASVKRIGRMHARENHHADLYSVDGAPMLCFLITRQGNTLTDVVAAVSAPALSLHLPRNVADPLVDAFHSMGERSNANDAPGVPWSGTVLGAIGLAITSAWPEYDASNGMGGGGQIGGPSAYAVNVTKASWLRLGSARQAAVLSVAAAAVARVCGLARPWPSHPDSEATIAIQECDPQPAGGQLRQSLTSGAYLAQKTVPVRAWQSELVD